MWICEKGESNEKSSFKKPFVSSQAILNTNGLERSKEKQWKRTFWVALERSFEIRIFVCKQGEFRSFLIVWNVPERSRAFTRNVRERTRSFVFKIACDDTFFIKPFGDLNVHNGGLTPTKPLSHLFYTEYTICTNCNSTYFLIQIIPINLFLSRAS